MRTQILQASLVEDDCLNLGDSISLNKADLRRISENCEAACANFDQKDFVVKLISNPLVAFKVRYAPGQFYGGGFIQGEEEELQSDDSSQQNEFSVAFTFKKLDGDYLFLPRFQISTFKTFALQFNRAPNFISRLFSLDQDREGLTLSLQKPARRVPRTGTPCAL